MPAEERLSIAVIANGSTGFGRSIVRGAMQYINLRRRWMIRTQLDRTRFLRDMPRFDGAIIGGLGIDEAEGVLKRCKAAVFCSGTLSPEKYLVASLDDYAVGRMAAEHLLECRLQRFGFYGLSAMGTSANRFRGFKETVEQAGFSCVEVGLGWVKPGTAKDSRRFKKLVDWLREVEKPIGLLAVDDSAANELASVCVEANIDVPGQVAILGVNNDELLCETSWPPLSSVDGGYNRVGYAAAAMLDRVLGGETLNPQERATRLPPLRVIARQSTDMLAISDEEVADAVRFIREHACDPCTVGDVVKHVAMNRRRLERRFVQVTGHGPHEEIMRVRIEAAKRLLLRPELKLEGIAALCGIPSIQHFRRAFLMSTGTTPSEFRRSTFVASD